MHTTLLIMFLLFQPMCNDYIMLEPDDSFGYYSLSGKPIESFGYVVDDCLYTSYPGENLETKGYEIFWVGDRIVGIFDWEEQDIKMSWVCLRASPNSIYLPFLGSLYP